MLNGNASTTTDCAPATGTEMTKGTPATMANDEWHTQQPERDDDE